jgi:hypothetical protein
MQQRTKQGPVMKNGKFVSGKGGKKGKRGKNRSKLGDDKGERNLSLNRVQIMPGSTSNFFRVKAGSTPGGVRCEGRELVSSLTLTSTSTGAFQLLTFGAGGASTATTFFYHPSSFPRLASYDSIYDQYYIHKCRIVFRPNQPTTAAGEIMGCTEYDTLGDTVPASSVAIMRHLCSDMANVYAGLGFTMDGVQAKLKRYDTLQQTGPNVELAYQALCFMGIEGFTGTGGAIVGYLLIEYDVEFYAPS